MHFWWFSEPWFKRALFSGLKGSNIIRRLIFTHPYCFHYWLVIIRPCVAGAVLQTPLQIIDSLIHSSFVAISSEHLHSPTLRARELKFQEKVHLPPPCIVSHVMCHVWRVTCHIFNRRGCSINSLVIHWLIQSVCEPFPPDLHNIKNHKQ